MKTFARFTILLAVIAFALGACGSDSADEVVPASDGLPINDGEAPPDEAPQAEPGDTDAPTDGAAQDLADGPLGAGPYPIAHLVIDFDDGDDAYTYEISCLGDTATVIGDEPGVNDRNACLMLAEFDVQERLTNPPTNQICTSEFGGPETAHITGTINDINVDTTATLTDGCGISEWDGLLNDILPTRGA